MSQIESLAKQADEKIRVWARETPKLIVAVDGYTGVGKTTLINELQKFNPNIVHVCQDDFLISVEPFVPGTHDEIEIANIIEAFKSGKKYYQTKIFNPDTIQADISKKYDLDKNILIIDGVFMFNPNRLNHLWDKRIYLDGNVCDFPFWIGSRRAILLMNRFCFVVSDSSARVHTLGQ